MNIEPLSVGWVEHDRPTRQASPEYMAHAETYTQTCQQVGDIRTTIIGLAESASMRPPLTRQELRSGTRNDELVEKLGDSAMVLLEEHDVATAHNRDAMIRLRDENNRIALTVPSAQPAKPSQIVTTKLSMDDMVPRSWIRG